MDLLLDEGEIFALFFPLTLSRHAFKLKVGALSNEERIELLSGEKPRLLIRNPILRNKIQDVDESIVIYPNFIIEKTFIERLLTINKSNFVIKSGDEILAYKGNPSKGEVINFDAKILKAPYDLLRFNKIMLYEDLVLLTQIYEKTKISNYVIGKFPIITNGSFNLESNVFFDAREGPIFLGDGAYIQAFSRIEGPTYIGEQTTIVTNSNIRRSYIGKYCVIGGEITNSIILDYTNSRHQSYIGDSYIGEWVNVGAHTVVSNLKNTYGEIKYDDLGSIKKTGMRKLGVIIGDHAKTSISAMLFSGSNIGFSSHVLYFLDRSIPSFTLWSGYEKKGYEIFLNSAIEVAKRFMESKKVPLKEEDIEIFKKIFEYTEKDRLKLGIQKAKFMRR